MMIEGYHEDYTKRRTGSGYFVCDLQIKKWCVLLDANEIQYGRATINLKDKTRGDFYQQWSKPLSSVQSFQIEAAATFDNRLYDQATGSSLSMKFDAPAWFMLGHDTSSSRHDSYGEHLLDSIYNSGNGPNYMLVLYAFFNDGSRELIALRRDAVTVAGRGYDGLLMNLTALTTGVREARRANVKSREQLIERSLYL